MEISLVCYPFQETMTIHALRLASNCARMRQSRLYGTILSEYRDCSDRAHRALIKTGHRLVYREDFPPLSRGGEGVGTGGSSALTML